VSYEQLWAPWRLPYIVSTKDERPPGCFLCRYVAQDLDAENLVVARGLKTVAVLNRFPYNNGHLLVAPIAHKATLEELDDAELLEAMQVVRRLVRALQRIMNPEGFNIGLNLGQIAGAGLPGHLHWHIVPRWSGDTNFMSVLAGVNVIPQALQALHELLSQELAADVA
jgi:ATP adenylyltransferase